MPTEPIRVLAEYEHGPYDFVKYPDDLDTLQQFGTSCASTTDLKIEDRAHHGVALVIDCLGHHVRINVRTQDIAALREALGPGAAHRQ